MAKKASKSNLTLSEELMPINYCGALLDEQ